MDSYPLLFSSATIGRMTVRNRIIMAPMGSNLATATGEISADQIAYYEARARGGVGLIIVEATSVDAQRGQSGAVAVRIDDDALIPSLHDLVEAVHRAGARIAIQLTHSGGSGRRTTLGQFAPTAGAVPGKQVRDMTTADIDDTIRKFGLAAERARRAGFDAVEIHAGHIYLISQFLSSATNQRTDEYGGDVNRRRRFLLDVVREVRSIVGNDYPLLCRINAESFMDDGWTIEQSTVLAKTLEEASIDAIDVSTGGPSYNFESACSASVVEPMSYPQGWRVRYAASIKKAVSIPVITVGVIREPEFAEGLLREGCADFVAIGRGLIADPEWAEKARTGNGHTIRKCISCNEGCYAYRLKGWRLRCSVNAVAGQERALGAVKSAPTAKRVAVLGGGPAGMECARIAAQRGHVVTLFERELQLGGLLRAACKPPGKGKLGWLIEYLEDELRDKNVRVVLGTAVSADFLRGGGFDAVVLAVGGRPIIPAGWEGKSTHLVTAVDVLSGRALPKSSDVVVIGGGSVGCETAAFLAVAGHRVTVCEMLDRVVMNQEPGTRWDLLTTLNRHGVSIRTSTRVLDLNDEGVVVANGDGTELLSATTIVLALGFRSASAGLAEELEGKVPKLYVVGDAARPGKIIDAVAAGHWIGRQI